MSGVIIAVAIVTGVGLFCSAVLVVASKFMMVSVDEKESLIREVLPGVNCGACGYSGCDMYAKALSSDPSVAVNLCIPGADSVSREISTILGVKHEDVVEKVAVLHCNGVCGANKEKHHYVGIESCSAAKQLFGGHGACSYGCIGFGDCAAACPVNAIDVFNGIAHIDARDCIGCGLCVSKCPNGIIQVIPVASKVVVVCSNHDKGAAVRKKCANGCIGCKKCETSCPSEAIKVTGNLAEIDYSKCDNCGACVSNCPIGCIAYEDSSCRYY